MSKRTAEDDLRAPGLARLLASARERYEALGGPRGSVRLESLDSDEARAIDAIWKRSSRRVRPRRGQDFSYGLRDLDFSLTETWGLSLEEALKLVGGPLALRPQLRAESAARTLAFWELALAHPLCDEHAARAWVQRLRQTGGLGARPFESDRGRTLLASLDVAATLPREPAVEQSTLATELLGDPHGLDDGSPVGDRVVALLAALEGRAGERLTAGERRALLGRFGVLCDPASATVLTLGLRPIGPTALEEAMRVLAGGHVVLTLGQLSRERPRFEDGLLVRLCENPAVLLRAEDRLGSDAAPLVCTGGWPGSAACALLDALRACNATFAHHGDFDWEGLAIARWLRDRYDACPWRFDRTEYLRALAAADGRRPVLRSRRHQYPADDPLVAELERHGVAVPEEAVLDDLMGDLAVAPQAAARNFS